MFQSLERATCLRLAMLLTAAAGLAGLLPAQPVPGVQSGTSSIGGPLTGVEGPIISESYILMPGDQLLVTVAGSVTYSYPAWITYEGKVFIQIPADLADPTELQVVDAVRISGLNIKAAQDSLSSTCRRFFRETLVKLTLTGMRSGVVFVTGEVQYPGAVYASPVERVSQVIAKAGGLTPLGSKTNIRVLRENRVTAHVNIELFESDGDLSANPFVQSGDRVYVPPVSGIITVKGAVFGRGEYRLRTSALTTEKERISEGIYELIPGERVLDMIKKAGGITPWADLRSSYILRRGAGRESAERIPVDLNLAMFQNDTGANTLLENDDVLVIPPINTLVYVEGEVIKPGWFFYTPNLKFQDYVGQAGGPTNYANLRRAHIIRNGTRVGARSNPVVEPGDIVMVPRVNVKWWQDYLQIFSSVGLPLALALVSYMASVGSR